MLCIPVLPLESGVLAKVDTKDFWRLADFDWYLLTCGYACRSEDSRMITMHREVIGAGEGERVDHINGDRLDNRRSNLRLATAQQNSRNKRKRKIGHSRFKGVSFARNRLSPWCAGLDVDGVRVRLGWFKSEILAAEAYDAAARKHFGEFACLNFPRAGEQSALIGSGGAA